MIKRLFAACFVLLALASCSKKEGGSAPYKEGGDERYDMAERDSSPSFDGDGGGLNGGPNGHQGGEAGVLTAGEWNDLQNWDFWGRLMTREPQESEDPAQSTPDYGKMAFDWGFNTSRRVAVNVKDASGAPVVNAAVELLKNGQVVWTTRTSNTGDAQLWQDMDSAKGQESGTEGLQIRIGGALQNEAPAVSLFPDAATVNEYIVPQTSPQAKADIAFIVDATGSMTDEIEFLKQDLLSILEKLQQSQSGIDLRTGAVFYRDTGDDYLVRTEDFGTPAQTMRFIRNQEAGGGGDLPEAVHTALESTLTELSWNTEARARVAFLILDAPAHIDHNGVVASLQKSIRQFAAKGIRIIPVLASTGDKTTEFMCRDFAIVTNGTYVFLTDDSGVGESHLTPTVGDYDVESLNTLLYRLLEAYIR